MEDPNPNFMATPPSFDHRPTVMDSNAWAQCDNLLAFSHNDPSNPAPFFQSSHTPPFPINTSSKGPTSQPFKNSYASRFIEASRPTGPGQNRRRRSQVTSGSRAQPHSKRQKIVSHAETIDICDLEPDTCGSVAGSQSECCSSCSDSPPCAEADCCAETDCELERVTVVPCFEEFCERPVCTSPCLDVGLKSQQATVGSLQPQTRTSSWLDSAWDPQLLRDPLGRNALEPISMFGHLEYLPACSSSVPTTPSMGNNIDTPYSPKSALQTPQFAPFPSHSPHTHQIIDALSGTGAVFSSSNGNWENQIFNNSGNANNSSIFNCAWTGCEQPFGSELEWLSHLHRDHVDPQMTFGCPIQGEECPQIIDTNPLDHLQTDHGYDFDTIENGFSCPASNCLPGETFLSPAMFHNHFDHVHGVPAQGSLYCRLETCDSSFVDPQDLISHISQYHKIPVLMEKEDDIDLPAPTETANILIGLPKAEATSTPNSSSNILDQRSLHTCKWKSEQDVLCDRICNSEEDLQKHIKYNHLDILDKQSGYKCQWDGCSRECRRGEKAGFSQRGKLERHMATHTGYKCCSCDECGRTFSAEQSLRQHQLLHKGEKPWICQHCGKGFPQQSACTIHERTHTKEKPLECTICGKRFSESSNLSKHRKIHGEKGLNTCGFPGCGKSFHRLDQLKRHRATHERQAERAKLKNGVENVSEVGISD